MSRYLRAVVAGGAIASSIMSAATTNAQPAPSGVVTATISGIVPVPLGPLKDNRDVGFGGTAGVRYAPAASSHFAIRLEVSGLLPSTHDNGRPNVTPHVMNGSSALFATVGPEFDIPAASGHFYTTASAGVAHIWASSSASNDGFTPAFGPYYTLTNRQTTNFAWGGGAGFVTPRSGFGLACDVGLRYYDVGRATYSTLYPGGSSLPGIVAQPYSTIGHHRTTFLAPSVGLSWRV